MRPARSVDVAQGAASRAAAAIGTASDGASVPSPTLFDPSPVAAPPIDDPLRAAMVALASLPGFGARRLWVSLERDPLSDFEAIRAGRAPAALKGSEPQRQQWVVAARSLDPDALLASHRSAGVNPYLFGENGFPAECWRDPHLPPLLFLQGPTIELPDATTPVVGIIGTRRASRSGLDLAREFGAELSERGCVVASGLAAGIDAAAHQGALAVGGSAPVAVIGSGHNVVYPRSNATLWSQVRQTGAIVSEYVLGTTPAAWRFPARNRILAALCDVLVVVESHERGGSLITAGVAGERGITVLAVPGSVRSATSFGTNRLIADGCQPCLGVDDILVALSLTARSNDSPEDSSPILRSRFDGRELALTPAESVVLDALGWEAMSIEALAGRCDGLLWGELAVAVAGLAERHLVDTMDGLLQRRSFRPNGAASD